MQREHSHGERNPSSSSQMHLSLASNTREQGCEAHGTTPRQPQQDHDTSSTPRSQPPPTVKGKHKSCDIFRLQRTLHASTKGTKTLQKHPTHPLVDVEQVIDGAVSDIQRRQMRQEVIAHKEAHEDEVVHDPLEVVPERHPSRDR